MMIILLGYCHISLNSSALFCLCLPGMQINSLSHGQESGSVTLARWRWGQQHLCATHQVTVRRHQHPHGQTRPRARQVFFSPYSMASVIAGALTQFKSNHSSVAISFTPNLTIQQPFFHLLLLCLISGRVLWSGADWQAGFPPCPVHPNKVGPSRLGHTAYLP